MNQENQKLDNKQDYDELDKTENMREGVLYEK